MPIPANAAARAYAAAQKSFGQAPKSTPDIRPQGPDFGSMLKDAVNTVTETGKATDLKTAQLAAGKADMVDVVTAITETETALETMITVRDRMIKAYEEIMHMPI